MVEFNYQAYADRAVNEIQERIKAAADGAAREALIELGWTPPDLSRHEALEWNGWLSPDVHNQIVDALNDHRDPEAMLDAIHKLVVVRSSQATETADDEAVK